MDEAGLWELEDPLVWVGWGWVVGAVRSSGLGEVGLCGLQRHPQLTA